MEAGGQSATLELHPRLTVIAGIGGVERAAIVTDLVSALGPAGDGTHVELVSDAGIHFAVFRPHGAPHQVVDVDAPLDVTDQFSDPSGRVDVLARAGLDVTMARAAMCIARRDLSAGNSHDDRIRRLAQVQQTELWVAAEALSTAQRRVEEESDALGERTEDAEVIALIEERHERSEQGESRFERRRRATFAIAGLSCVGSVPLSVWYGPATAVPLLALAIVSAIGSILTWRGATRARRAELEALACAGASSYLGFHIQRVNGLLSSDRARRDMMQATEKYRECYRRWTVVAGDTDLAWALAHRDEIDAAVRLRRDVVGSGPGVDGEVHEAGTVAHALHRRLDALRVIGPGNESFPALLDEPFADLDPAATPAMLELLVRSSEHQQIVLLTCDEAIAAWARLEAMTGELALVEASASPAAPERTGVELPHHIV